MRTSRISITTGVLPGPPTVMLPTTTTRTRPPQGGNRRIVGVLRGLLERVGEALGAAKGCCRPVDRVLSARIDRDVEHLRALRGALRRCLREVDLQLRIAAVSGREEQEDQDDDQDV